MCRMRFCLSYGNSFIYLICSYGATFYTDLVVPPLTQNSTLRHKLERERQVMRNNVLGEFRTPPPPPPNFLHVRYHIDSIANVHNNSVLVSAAFIHVVDCLLTFRQTKSSQELFDVFILRHLRPHFRCSTKSLDAVAHLI